MWSFLVQITDEIGVIKGMAQGALAGLLRRLRIRQ
jgi:hypothetical protein